MKIISKKIIVIGKRLSCQLFQTILTSDYSNVVLNHSTYQTVRFFIHKILGTNSYLDYTQ